MSDGVDPLEFAPFPVFCLLCDEMDGRGVFQHCADHHDNVVCAVEVDPANGMVTILGLAALATQDED